MSAALVSCAHVLLDRGQDLVEHVEHAVQLVAGDRERRLDLEDVAEAGVPGGAEDYPEVHSAPVHLQRLRGRGFPGVLVAHELDADEQARSPDVADEPVPRLHRAQAVGGVFAHVGAGLQQAVLFEYLERGDSGGEADREFPEGQGVVPGWKPVSSASARTPASGNPPPTPLPKTRMSGVTS